MKKLKLSNDTDDVYSILDSTLFSKTKKKSLYDGFKKNKTVNEVFQKLNTHSSSLTPEEIDKAKETITNSVESETKTLRERIVEFLTDNPSKTREVGEEFGLAREDVRSILYSMRRKGIVINNNIGKSKVYTWSICQ